jgi:archaetidylinositol phosphate synthase
MLSTVKPKAEKAIKPLALLLKNVDPNVISLFGLLFPILFFWCVMEKQYALALVVFIFNGVDMLDGMVARMTGKVTAFGGFLDSTIDRFADFTVIAVFGFAGLVGWNIILPLLMLTYLISYIRSRTELAAKAQLVANVGFLERTERLIGIFVGLLLYALYPNATLAGLNIMAWTCLVLIALSAFTVGQRFVFAYQKLHSLTNS